MGLRPDSVRGREGKLFGITLGGAIDIAFTKSDHTWCDGKNPRDEEEEEVVESSPYHQQGCVLNRS